MAASALFIIITVLLPRVLANNVTTPFLLPDGIFNWNPSPQTFVGQYKITGSTTYYTLNCGPSDRPFWPGPNGCDGNNSYTFSADPTSTRFLLVS